MDARKESIDTHRKAHPLDAELFGTLGAIAAELYIDVSKDFIAKQFPIMGPEEFKSLDDCPAQNRIYWSEMLFRVYWAAAMNLMRHHRWQAGCVAAFVPANHLSFAASLRGLIEGSLDANYSLMQVPFTLASVRATIESALHGTLQQPCVSRELEDRLIHFVFARKIGRVESTAVPSSHAALDLDPKD